MKYMLLIANNPANFPTDQAAGEQLMKDYNEFSQLIKDSGEFVAGEHLASNDTATTVRVRGGKTAVTDGPFAETTEQLGGFYIVDVPHLDRALELAALIPTARDGVIDVRPIVET